MPYNLGSPNGLLEAVDLGDVAQWFKREIQQVASDSVRNVLCQVADNLTEFVEWPAQAVLLWEECDRIALRGKHRYHQYPEAIKSLAKKNDVILDGRANGPAIAAFRLAGGVRPKRFGSSNSWSIHHLYSGKFPYIDRVETLHAAKECLHFTQSAGLVATHPVADALCDEYPFFAWLLRAESFRRFGYDPDKVFSTNPDKFGFVEGRACSTVTL